MCVYYAYSHRYIIQLSSRVKNYFGLYIFTIYTCVVLLWLSPVTDIEIGHSNLTHIHLIKRARIKTFMIHISPTATNPITMKHINLLCPNYIPGLILSIFSCCLIYTEHYFYDIHLNYKTFSPLQKNCILIF